ncbi:MAG: hypothetical protein ACRCVU_00840 [Flavobacterium sp.]
MKRSLLLIPVLLITVGNVFSQQTKKMTVVSQIREKSYTYIDNDSLHKNFEILQDGSKVTSIKSKADFSYTVLGELKTIKRSEIDIKNPPPLDTVNFKMRNKYQLKTIDLNSEVKSLSLTYQDDNLHQYIISEKKAKKIESIISTYCYSNNQLPEKVVINIPDSNIPVKISFKYNKDKNLQSYKIKQYKTSTYYDTKKYPFSYLPYGFSFSNYFLIEGLVFTNYVQSNNVIKREWYGTTQTILYTYNDNDLPITAKVYNKYKNNNHSYLMYECEFVYKEIEVPNT